MTGCYRRARRRVPFLVGGYSLVELLLFLMIAGISTAIAIPTLVPSMAPGQPDLAVASGLRHARTVALITRCPTTLSLPNLEILIPESESTPDPLLFRASSGVCNSDVATGTPLSGPVAFSATDAVWLDVPHTFLAHRMPDADSDANPSRVLVAATGATLRIDALTGHVAR